MSVGSFTINDLIRKRIRSLRLARGLTMKEVADKCGIADTSYKALEYGSYRLNVDNLFRILCALDVTPSQIWPSSIFADELTESRMASLQGHEFRLCELVRLTGSGGGAVFRVEKRPVVLLSHHMSILLLDWCCLSIERRREPEEGRVFYKDKTALFLKQPENVKTVAMVVKHYLSLWEAAFEDKDLAKAAQQRQLQPADEA